MPTALYGTISFYVGKFIFVHVFPSIVIVSVGALIVTEDYVTNNSIIRGSHSGWGIVTYLTGKTVEERVGAYDTTIWSMKVEIEAITVAVDRPG